MPLYFVNYEKFIVVEFAGHNVNFLFLSTDKARLILMFLLKYDVYLLTLTQAVATSVSLTYLQVLIHYMFLCRISCRIHHNIPSLLPHNLNRQQMCTFPANNSPTLLLLMLGTNMSFSIPDCMCVRMEGVRMRLPILITQYCTSIPEHCNIHIHCQKKLLTL